MRKIFYNPKVPAEVRELLEYYDGISRELGDRFWSELSTALAVNLDEAKALECGEHLTPGEQRKIHRERATTSWVASSMMSCGDGSR